MQETHPASESVYISRMYILRPVISPARRMMATMARYTCRGGYNTKERQRSSLQFEGKNLFNAPLAIMHQDDLKNRKNCTRTI